MRRALRVVRGVAMSALLVGLIVAIIDSRVWPVLAAVLALGLGVTVLEHRDRRAGRELVRREADDD